MICLFIGYSRDGLEKKEVSVLKEEQEEKRGVFVSYIELQNYIKDEDEGKSKENVLAMINNIKKMNLNLIVLQVRSNSDAIYESKIFPVSGYVSTEEGGKCYDVLEYFIKEAHKKKIAVYAWINPYRIRTNEDVSSISEKNPAFKYINTDIIYVGGGIYYNPSKKEVEDLIVRGVEEIVNNYQVDGILFDDYFYPNNEIDQKDYEQYKKEFGEIKKEDYNLMIVNKLIERVHKVCNKAKIPFGVSPDGNNENNYNKNFADIKTWLSSDKYVDFIMPQIYYGFYNETKPFQKVLEEWNSLIKNKKIKMIVALAFYKVGMYDKYAKSGAWEWERADDIIMKEIILSRNISSYDGFCLFRYGYLFDNKLFSNTSVQEKDNIFKIINR